jgi:hypothetical protein
MHNVGRRQRTDQENYISLLSYLNFYTYEIPVANKKENIENLQKKLGEVLGLERAAQKVVTELISMKVIKSNSRDEATSHFQS